MLRLSTHLRRGRTYFKSFTPNVVQVSAHRIIRGLCYPCELEALLYVRKHTTIPVPRVYRTYLASKGRIYILGPRLWWKSSKYDERVRRHYGPLEMCLRLGVQSGSAGQQRGCR